MDVTWLCIIVSIKPQQVWMVGCDREWSGVHVGWSMPAPAVCGARCGWSLP